MSVAVAGLAGSGSVTIVRLPKASIVKIFQLPAGSVDLMQARGTHAVQVFWLYTTRPDDVIRSGSRLNIDPYAAEEIEKAKRR